MEDMPLETMLRMFFQNGGMPPHFSHQIMPYMNQSYENWWLGHAGPILWLPDLWTLLHSISSYGII
jgi:hypothetical protein